MRGNNLICFFSYSIKKGEVEASNTCIKTSKKGRLMRRFIVVLLMGILLPFVAAVPVSATIAPLQESSNLYAGYAVKQLPFSTEEGPSALFIEARWVVPPLLCNAGEPARAIISTQLAKHHGADHQVAAVGTVMQCDSTQTPRYWSFFQEPTSKAPEKRRTANVATAEGDVLEATILYEPIQMKNGKWFRKYTFTLRNLTQETGETYPNKDKGERSIFQLPLRQEEARFVVGPDKISGIGKLAKFSPMDITHVQINNKRISGYPYITQYRLDKPKLKAWPGDLTGSSFRLYWRAK